MEPAQATANPTPVPTQAEIEAAILAQVFPGKNFKSVDDAKNSYWNLVNHSSKLEELIANAQPVNPTAAPDPFSRLASESLVDPSALREAILAVLQPELKREFGPIAQALAARDEMVRRFPGFNETEPKVLQFLAQNPELNKRVQQMTSNGFALEAQELAMFNYNLANPAPSTPAPSPAAGLPGSPASAPARPATPPEDRANILKQAIDHAIQTGDERAVWAETYKDFKPILPAEFQNG